jgi:hypothetical protein
MGGGDGGIKSGRLSLTSFSPARFMKTGTFCILSGQNPEAGNREYLRMSPFFALLWIHGHIGTDERVDQVFDSGLEDMDVLVRLDADYVFSHP